MSSSNSVVEIRCQRLKQLSLTIVLFRFKLDVGVVVGGLERFCYYLLPLGRLCLCSIGYGLGVFFIGFVAPILQVRTRDRFIQAPYVISARLPDKPAQEVSRFGAIVGKVTGSPFRIFLQ